MGFCGLMMMIGAIGCCVLGKVFGFFGGLNFVIRCWLLCG